MPPAVTNHASNKNRQDWISRNNTSFLTLLVKIYMENYSNNTHTKKFSVENCQNSQNTQKNVNYRQCQSLEPRRCLKRTSNAANGEFSYIEDFVPAKVQNRIGQYEKYNDVVCSTKIPNHFNSNFKCEKFDVNVDYNKGFSGNFKRIGENDNVTQNFINYNTLAININSPNVLAQDISVRNFGLHEDSIRPPTTPTSRYQKEPPVLPRLCNWINKDVRSIYSKNSQYSQLCNSITSDNYMNYKNAPPKFPNDINNVNYSYNPHINQLKPSSTHNKNFDNQMCGSMQLYQNYQNYQMGKSINQPKCYHFIDDKMSLNYFQYGGSNQINDKFTCPVDGCGKVYNKSSHLKAHSRWHNTDRPFLCKWPLCGKRFTRSDELKRHDKTHTGEKKYVCDICEKRFMRTDHLAKHKKTHEKASKRLRVDKAKGK